MYENYGDVVLFDGDDKFSRAIRFFTRQQYVHSGLLVGENIASQINIKGKEILVDLNDAKDHDSCLVLTYSGMTSERRIILKEHYEDLISTHTYDVLAILKLARRHAFKIPPDETNILRNGGTFCTSLDSLVYERTFEDIGFKVKDGVHHSQTEAHHFLEKFEVVKEVKLK